MAPRTRRNSCARWTRRIARTRRRSPSSSVPTRPQKLEEYQRSMPARQELDMLARQLDGADTPLNEDQQKRLLAVLTEERKRTPSPSHVGRNFGRRLFEGIHEVAGDYEESVASQVRSVLNTRPARHVRRIPGMATADALADGRWCTRDRSVTFAGAAPAVSMDVAVAPPPDRRSSANDFRRTADPRSGSESAGRWQLARDANLLTPVSI